MKIQPLSDPSPLRYPVGLMVVLVLITITKGVIFRAAEPALQSTLLMSAADGVAVAVLIGVAGLLSVLRHRLLRGFLFAALLICVSLLVLDLAVSTSTGKRLQWSDVVEFADESEIFLSFIGIRAVAFTLIFAAAVSIRCVLSPRAVLLFILIVLLPRFAIDSSEIPDLYRRNSIAAFFTWRRIARSKSRGVYPPDFAATSYQKVMATPLSLPEGTPNIIVLMVESLSLVDFKSLGGLQSQFPRFESRLVKGQVFTNFFNNYHSSTGAYLSTLNAMAPIPFPRQKGGALDRYPIIKPVPRLLNNRGYQSEMLTATDLDFDDLNALGAQLGFGRLSGLNEVERFTQAPRFVFGWPADGVLFDEAKERINAYLEARAKFFMVLLTMSTHFPYTDPLGRGDTEANAFDYTDQQLSAFYDGLESSGYFKNGLLIVFGDHRKWDWEQEGERKALGPGYFARVPLVIFGKGARAGKTDQRLWSQADLFRNLDRALHTEARLSDYVAYYERDADERAAFPNGELLRVVTIEGTQRREDPLLLYGPEMEWPRAKPENAAAIEEQIATQRAALQYIASAREDECRFRSNQSVPREAPHGHGMLVRHFHGQTIDEAPTADREFPDSALRVSKIDFEDLTLPPFRVGSDEALVGTGLIEVPQEGYYQFRLESDDGSCLAIDGESVIEANYRRGFSPPSDSQVYLSEGLHHIELRYFQASFGAGLRLSWRPPANAGWEVIPEERLYLGVEAKP